ncbi:MAG: DUF2254 domain-containing protein [Verrucomicrobiota bacterium]
MISRLKYLFELTRLSFWFVPSAIAVGSILSAEALIAVDRKLLSTPLGLFDNFSADGVRTLLSTSASGIISLAALVFSTTLVALTLASSQFGPRVLHNFIRARSNQITLGVLLGTFLFSLIVLRSARDESLPQISALVAFTLTLVSLGLFIFFVDRLVRSLQAENVVETVAVRLFERVDEVFPQSESKNTEEAVAEKEREQWQELNNEKSVNSDEGGYLQFVDVEKLTRLAASEECRVRVIIKVGELLLAGDCLFAYERSGELSDEAQRRFLNCFIIGRQRTPDQDFEFEIRQLVEIGVRALSPGINDPFTAINCIDLLTVALGRIAERELSSTEFRDEEGQLRLRLNPTSFHNLLDAAFLQLRNYGADRPEIVLGLLSALEQIASKCSDDARREVVIDMAVLVAEEADAADHTKFDRDRIGQRIEEIKTLSAEKQ